MSGGIFFIRLPLSSILNESAFPIRKIQNIAINKYTILEYSQNFLFFNKLGILTLIVEVKKNKQETKISQGQILSYERIAPVYVLDNISDAEKIISILLTKKLIST